MARVLNECLNISQGHGARGNAQATDHGNCNVIHVGDHRHGGLNNPGDKLRTKTALVHLLVRVVELSDCCVAVTEDFNEFLTGEGFLDLTIQFSGPLPLLNKLWLGSFGNQHGDSKGQRDCD